jgi:hypothetical protein
MKNVKTMEWFHKYLNRGAVPSMLGSDANTKNVKTMEWFHEYLNQGHIG